MKVGFLTIGQSPRVDVMKDLAPMLSREKVEYIQVGALDNLSREQIEKLKPDRRSDYVLVSRLRDGSEVKLSREKIMPEMQRAIGELEPHVDIIGLLCTGEFPELHSWKPLIEPSLLLRKTVEALSPDGPVTILIPSPLQENDVREKWGSERQLQVIAISPYTSTIEEFQAKLKYVNAENIVVMDCIGYSMEMKAMVKKTMNRPVILPRTMLARVVAEIS